MDMIFEGFRRHRWDDTLSHYYDSFVSTLRSLGVTERLLSVSFDEFREAVRASVPLALFFCGNVQDFDLHAEAADARRVGGGDGDLSGDEDDELEEAFRKMQRCKNAHVPSKSILTDVFLVAWTCVI